MNILFYTSFSKRSRDVESVILAHVKKGHKVYFISNYKHGDIHNFLSHQGIPVHYIKNESNKVVNVFQSVFILAKFCYKNNIQLIHSHLEQSNFVACLTQFLIKAQVVIHRHHANDFILSGWSKSWSYRFTNRLCKVCVVYSEFAKTIMVNHEGMKENKLRVFPLMYDFNLYPKPEADEIDLLRAKYSESINLIVSGRFVSLKRFDLAIDVLKKAKEENLNCILHIVGDGPLLDYYIAKVKQLDLLNNVNLIGRVANMMTYLTFADILLHPSISESSSVIVKEAGLCHCLPIVCYGVGDFDDYLKDGYNALLVDPEFYIEETFARLKRYKLDRNQFHQMTIQLDKDVRTIFGVEENIYLYNEWLNI